MALVTGAKCRCGNLFNQIQGKWGGLYPPMCKTCNAARIAENDLRYQEQVTAAREQAHRAAAMFTDDKMLRNRLIYGAEIAVMRSLVCKLTGDGEIAYWVLVTKELES